MAIELATAYVSILPETSKIAPGVARALAGAEKSADRSGRSMGGKIAAGLGGVLKKSAVGVGVSAGGAIGAGLAKGLGRLNSIEQAQAKLKGLGHSAQSVGNIMKDSLAAVKGTSFGLEEAAQTAAGVVAAGIKPGKELEQVLKTVGDTATIAGTSMGEMGTIFGSVAARGKLQGDDMLQLLSRGVPVLQLLAEETGKTSAEISDMVSDGQIDFATFERAMRKGLGGAALEAGNTVQGALRNMGAAAGRLGATMAGPLFKRAAGGINGVTGALDAMDARMKPVMQRVDAWLTAKGVPAFQRFGASARAALESFKNSGTVARTVQVFGSMGQVAADLAPVLLKIGSAVGQAAASLGVGSWQVFLTALDAVGLAAKALTPPLEVISGLMEAHPGMVAAAVAAWTGFKTIPGLIAKIPQPVKDAAGAMKEMGASAAAFRKAHPEITRTGVAVRMLGANVPVLGQMGAAFKSAGSPIRGFGAAISAGVMPALGKLKAGVSGVVGALGGPWGLAFAGATIAVTSAVQGLADMGRVLDAHRSLTTNASSSYKSMFDAIATGGSRLDVAKSAIDSMTSSMQTMADNGPNLFHRTLLGIEEHTYGLVGLQTEYMNTGASVRHMSDSAKAATETMKDLGLTNEQLAVAATGSSTAYESMHAKLMESGRGGEFLAGELERLRQKFQESQAAADAMGPSGLRFAQVIDEIASKTGTAEDRASKLRIALLELSGGQLSAAESGAELTNTIDQVAQKMGSFAGAAINANGQLDVTSKAGADAHEALVDLGDAMQRSVAAGNDVNQVYGQFEAQLSGLKTQLGLTDDQYRKLLEAYGMTPEQLTTVANVQTDAAKAALVGLNQQLKDNEGEKTITMRVADADAQTRLESMGFKLKKLDDSGTVEIDVSDQAARAKLDGVVAEFAKISNANPTAHAVLDADGLFATKEFALAQLATLDLARPTPLANMNTSMLSAKQIEALQKVGLLDGQRPTPAAMMNIDQLSAEQQTALAKVFDLGAQTPTPLADMDKNQLDVRADEANARLKQLHDTKTEPRVTADTKQAMDELGGVRSLLGSLKDKFINVFVRRHDSGHADGGRFARGGKLNRYATGDRHDGYRIPSTGPGSNGTDKWLAVDQYNQPVARLDHGEWIINRRSSSKYDKELAAINAGTFPKLPGYAEGGVFDDVLSGQSLRSAKDFLRFARGKKVDGEQASRSLQGAPYNNYPANPSDWGDCSYTAGKFAAFGLGVPTPGRKFSTVSQLNWLRSHGAQIGMGPEGSLRIGWYDNGGGQFGHTSTTLPDGTNAEMGGGNGGGAIGGGAAPWNHPQFTHHAWIPAADGSGDGEAMAPAGGGSAAPGSGVDKDMVPLSDEASDAAETLHDTDPGLLGGKSTWSDFGGSVVAAAVGGQISDILSVFGIPNELPPVVKAGQQWYQAAKEANQKSAEFAKAEKDLIKAADAVEKTPETASEQVFESTGDATKDAVKKALSGRGWDTGAEWDAIDFIVSHESNWNPNAVNPSSGAFGLFQLNPASGTLQAYLPSRSADPAEQAEAGARYIEDRYGSAVKARAFWEAHHWYDKGGRASGIGHMLKNTLKPERVLSPEQTKAFEDLVYTKLPMLSDGEKQAESFQATEQSNRPAEGAKKPVATFEVDPGSVQNTVNNALPLLMQQNSWADAAKLVASSAVSAAGTTAISGSGAALPGGMQLASTALVGVGSPTTDAAAWYAGEVAWGVTNAFEQYSKELFGTVLTPFQDVLGVIKTPVVGEFAAGAGIDIPAGMSWDSLMPESVMAANRGGDVYQFISQSREGIFSDFRREKAKGAIGAR